MDKLNNNNDDLRFVMIHNYVDDETIDIPSDNFLMAEDDAYKLDAFLRERYAEQLKTETGTYSVADIMPLSYMVFSLETAIKICIKNK